MIHVHWSIHCLYCIVISKCKGNAPPATDGWDPIIPLPVQSASSFGIGLRGTPLGDTLGKINQLRSQGPVFLIARTEGQVERLLALMADHEYPAAVAHLVYVCACALVQVAYARRDKIKLCIAQDGRFVVTFGPPLYDMCVWG